MCAQDRHPQAAGMPSQTPVVTVGQGFQVSARKALLSLQTPSYPYPGPSCPPPPIIGSWFTLQAAGHVVEEGDLRTELSWEQREQPDG